MSRETDRLNHASRELAAAQERNHQAQLAKLRAQTEEFKKMGRIPGWPPSQRGAAAAVPTGRVTQANPLPSAATIYAERRRTVTS